MKYKLFYILLFSITQLLSGQNTNKEIEKLFNKALSFHYSNKDSAYYYYEKTIKLANTHNDLTTLLSSYLYLMNANGNNYDLKNYALNIKRNEELLFNDKRLDTFSNLAFYKNYLLFDKGNYNYKLKQYTTSKKYFKELLSIINAIPQKEKTKQDLEMLSSIYSFLGVNYRHTGKYDLAESLFKKDIQLQYTNKDSMVNWESGFYNSKKLLSQVYEVKKEYTKANLLLKESLSYYKKNASNLHLKNNILSTFILLAKNYLKQNKFNKTIEILNENNSFHKEDNPFDKKIDILYGDAYLGLKKYKKAAYYYEKSLTKTKEYRANKKHIDIAKIHGKIGHLFIEQNKFDKGLQQYQLALMQLQNEFNKMDINTNPDPKKAVSKIELIRVLKEKLQALNLAYTNYKNIDYLKKAHKTSKVIIKTLDELRPEFESKLDKQFLVEETYPSIQKMVEISYKLYHLTNNTKYIDDAFFFMEKSKSILLLEATKNTEATKYGDLPKEIIDKEQQLRAEISHLEQAIFKQNKKDKKLEEDLYSVKDAYYDFLSTIENQYPKYYALKYKNDIVSLKSISSKLQNNEAILSYLVSGDKFYLIVIEQDKNAFYQFPYTKKIQSRIKKLYRKSSKLNIQDTTIYKDSHIVYKAILEKALQNTQATNLTIITDDLLSYIPFDALNTSDKGKEFLLKTHSISYANSVTLLQEQNKKVTNKKSKLLVFAPKFKGYFKATNHERTGFSPLLYNEQEAKYISQYFNGKVYKDYKASISNFNKEINNYNLIHFTTHASVNDVFPDYSYLAFSDNGETSNLLYVKNLYNYNINADLATLSACETGVGKLQKGEGIMSLARAFNYAGVPAIVTTLWKIDDESTSEIMEYFYQNLNNGLNKKEALRQAKLTYLELNDDDILKHPYYWSGIVLTGNVEQVASANYFIWILLGVLLLIFVYYIFNKKK